MRQLTAEEKKTSKVHPFVLHDYETDKKIAGWIVSNRERIQFDFSEKPKPADKTITVPPITVEYFNGNVQLLVFSDRTSESPSHVIRLDINKLGDTNATSRDS